MQATATGTFGNLATMITVHLLRWNTYRVFGTIAELTYALDELPANMSAEIHITYTTANAITTPFYSFAPPAGCVIIENDMSDAIEPNNVYEATIFNTGQVDDNNNIIIGITTVKWSE